MTTVPPAFTLDDVAFFGARFARPECVLCTRAGDLFASDRRGGVSHVTPGGEHRLITGATLDLAGPLLPNGIALDRDGSFLIAHLSDSEGGVFRLQRDGRLTPVLRAVDGVELAVTNFVLVDTSGRIYVTISTRHQPRVQAFRPGVHDGYIVLIDDSGARIVADGLGFANEVRIDPSRQWLYVNETYARRLSRLRLRPDGTLGPRESVAQFDPGEFPDGITFDAEGCAWITCIVSSRLIRVVPDGRRVTMLEDCEPSHIETVEAAYQAGTLTRDLLDRPAWRKLAHISSLAFGGPDLRTGYLGILLGDRLPMLRMPVAGTPMAHWEW
jgi:sugar lactone lactonase YvrE